ncbi:MAG: serine hydrolase [candidate division WOR-3 bacterium]|nr:MAG: serine hydrolase [candidate division WOR-3 bacterium]
MNKKVLILLYIIIGTATLVNVSTAEALESKLETDIKPNHPRLSEHLRHTEPNILTARHDSVYLDSLIDTLMAQYHIPGLAACAIKNGEIIWTGSYGYANFAQNIEVGDTTLFMLASISKTVTGVALMQVWERGLFELDNNINDYLPFAVHNYFFPDSVITFRMLLAHTSSINDNWTILNPLAVLGDSPIALGEFLEDYLIPGGAYYDTLNFNNWSPGIGYDYCNVAAALAGYLVEAIEDSFPTYCRDSLFTPLSMNETSWFLAGLDINNVAMPYYYSGGTHHAYGHWGHPMYPAFQLRTSTLQLARYLIAFMQYGEIDTVRILDSTTVELMTTVQNPSIHPNQGLFWYRDYVDGKELWGHNGSTAGFETRMYYCPAETTAAIILTNGESSVGVDLILPELFEYAAEYGIAEMEEYSLKSQAVSLQQNRPNPFNRTTTFRFDLPAACYVELNVYNVLGQKVFTLVDGKLNANEHSIAFDAQSLPSGVYYYQLRAGDIVQTKRCVLLR